MKKILLLLFFIVWLGLNLKGQVAQFPQVFMNGQGAGGFNLLVRSSTSFSASSNTSVSITSYIGAESFYATSENYNWIRVCLPSTSSTKNTPNYGYMACHYYYMRINETNNFATVSTTSTPLGVRTCAGCTNSYVTLNGANIFYGNASIVALTGYSSSGWYEIYLPNGYSQSKGWVNGTYIILNGATTNYRVVGGGVCDNQSSCPYLGNINAATIMFSGLGSTTTSGGYYQYKLPTNQSTIITCSHPSYNTSLPSSYSHPASSHNYSRDFILSNNIPCSYALTPPSNSVTSDGGSFTIDVKTGSSCSWTALSNDALITINSGSGPGDGICKYTVFKNLTTNPKSGTIKIGDKTFTVTQAAGKIDCTYTLPKSSSPTIPLEGGSGYNFDVTANCSWTALSSDSWITITTKSAPGNGTCTYSVDKNPKTTIRIGYISIGDKTFTVTQAAGKIDCSYTLSQYSSTTIPSDGGSGYTFGVTANCSWTASVGTDSWIKITNGSASGDGTCTYSVDKNPTTNIKTGDIKIGDKTYTITQDAGKIDCSYSLPTSNNLNVPSEGGPYSFSILAGIGCNWEATVSDPWITIKLGKGSGNGTCSYNINHNPNPSTRTGYIYIQGKTFTVTQAAGNDVNTKLVAEFSCNKNNITPNTTVQFYDDSYPSPSSVKWTFYGKGVSPSSSTDERPKVTYSQTGSFSVNLTVSSSLGSDTETKTGYITVSRDGTNQLIPRKEIGINAPQVKVSDPIQTGTGTYIYSHKDFSLPTIDGSINFTRFYNTVNNTLNGSLGYGWSHTYNYFIDIQRDEISMTDTVWSVHYPDGHYTDFIPLYYKSGVFPRSSFSLYGGNSDSLVMVNSNEFILFSKDNRKHHFNGLGQLTKITDFNSNATLINYFGANISSIIGQGGRTLKLYYSGSNLSSVEDPNSRKCNFTYDANGNLKTSEDPKGGITNFNYDVNHRMTAIVNCLGDTIVNNTFDPQGRVIIQMDALNQKTLLAYDTPSFGYTTITNPDKTQIIAYHDQFFRKTNIKNELGLTTSYTYDNNNNETSFMNENGITETKEFDWRDNLKTKTIGSDITSQYVYNSLNSPLKITTPNGKNTAITYDVNNNPTSIHFPDSTNQYFEYNSDGTSKKSIDARNNGTLFKYSTSGDMISLIAPNGTKTFDYDASGRLISVTDENNHQIQIEYDDNDNIISMTDPLQRTSEFKYDANNQLLSTKDKIGNITKFSYDKKGRLKLSTNPKGGITSYSYDSRDNTISITDANQNIISLTYDKNGRKSSISDALGVTKYQYDGVGNLTKVIDGTGKVIEYAYTTTNKIQSIKDGLMNSITYTYDKNDNLISMINALNKTTVYSYDEMNRLISVLDADNKTTSITYDENGNKKTITDPNGHAQSFNYDAANRLILHSDASKYDYSYNYDKVGNILSITTPIGTITKSYDDANRVLTISNSSDDNYSFTYDKNDNIATMRNKIGTSVMIYDSLNQLIQYTDPFNKTVTFTYDDMGNKTSITYPGNHKVIYKYDNTNRLKSVTDWLNHTFTYTYDEAGRNTQLTYPNGIKCDLVFDDAARLLSKKNSTSTSSIINSSQFVLDPIGNRISEQRSGPIPTDLIPSSKVYNYSDDDGMKTNSVWNYTNDASGKRTTETKGNKTVKYSFSVDNLLSNKTDTLGITTTFGYDPLGHRLSKTTGSTQSRFVLDLSSSLSMVLQITDANGTIKSEFVYGLGLLERIDPANNVLFYHFDAQHNTVALSNKNAAITDTYTYDPFGTLLTHKGNTSQPFTFLSEFGVEQENNSLYFVRARYYDSANGRFLSKDVFPSEIGNPQTINRYVYSINNPLTKFDFNGFYANQDNSAMSNSDIWASIFKNTSDAADILTIIEGKLPNPIPTSLYVKVTGGYKLVFFDSGKSLLTKSSSFLGTWGGPLVSGLSTFLNANDILSGHQETSNYFDLTISSSSTAIGLAGAGAITGVITAPVWVTTAAIVVGIGGAIYGVGNLVSNFWDGQSLSERWFNH